MPYHKVKGHSSCAADEIAVVKDRTGEVMGCHASDEKANRQLAALNAAERDESSVAATESGPPIEHPMPHGFVARYAAWNRDLDWFETLVENLEVDLNHQAYEYDQGHRITLSYDELHDLVTGARCALEALKGDEGL